VIPSLGAGGRRGAAWRFEALQALDWPLFAVLAVIAGGGMLMQASISGGSLDPWAGAHGLRFLMAVGVAIVIGLTPLPWWLRLAYPIYGMTLLLLLGVEFFGDERLGAQRWLQIGPMSLQPSEIMKIAIVLATARAVHDTPTALLGSLRASLLPLGLIIAPVGLVAHQPDLGTSILVAISGLSIVFLSGLKWPVIAVAGLGGAIAGPLFVMFGLKDYQRERVLTFLDPGRDPLGAGYHITQSKIAIGNGGWTGAGIGQGTQSRLDFLPEQHTDFIFTALAEETGFVGVMVLIGLFGFVFLRLMAIGADCRNLFGRMVASGVAVTIISYVLINMAMVSGLIPVVGVPLPLVSYGGTAMLTVMVGIGLALSARNGAAMTMPPMSSLI